MPDKKVRQILEIRMLSCFQRIVSRLLNAQIINGLGDTEQKSKLYVLIGRQLLSTIFSRKLHLPRPFGCSPHYAWLVE